AAPLRSNPIRNFDIKGFCREREATGSRPSPLTSGVAARARRSALEPEASNKEPAAGHATPLFDRLTRLPMCEAFPVTRPPNQGGPKRKTPPKRGQRWVVCHERDEEGFPHAAEACWISLDALSALLPTQGAKNQPMLGLACGT